MKFVSKFNNYSVILSPGIPESKISGTPARPAIFVRFENGLATVNDEEIIEMMLNHKQFGADFLKVEDEDPYAATRKENEPDHDITEIQYGTIGKSVNPKKGIKLSREKMAELQEFINEEANKKAMLILKELSSKGEKEAEEGDEIITDTAESSEEIDVPETIKADAPEEKVDDAKKDDKKDDKKETKKTTTKTKKQK